MDWLAPEQKQVLLKMRSSTNPAEQFDSYYQVYKGHDFEMRFFDYRWIAYYLDQSERQEIYEYFQNKFALQKDEKVRQDYQWFRSSLEKYNEKVRGHVYSQRDTNLKNAMKALTKDPPRQPKLTQANERQRPSLLALAREKFSYLFKGILNTTYIEEDDEKEQEKQKLT